jgi:hypothetical protein
MPRYTGALFHKFRKSAITHNFLAMLGTQKCVGMGARRSVEICCGDGIECNTANLILNHGFTGLLVDGDPKKIAACRSYYGNHPDSRIWPPVIEHAWISS